MCGSSPRVGVVGGGIFGCTIALSLAEAGLQVLLLESKPQIMEGASKNNQNRLHLGFHYPRDLATALQCARGFQRFVDAFPESIACDFPNAYFIAASGSLTSPDEYLGFCEKAGLSYSLLDLPAYPTEIRDCALGLLCNEAVYDCAVLKKVLLSRISASARIELRCGTEVVAINPAGGSYGLQLQGSGETLSVAAVVNCSYADINRLTAQCGHPLRECQFEYTVVPIIELDIPKQGITIMDGPFLTLLPFGKTDSFLLYHVRHTVVATEVGLLLNPAWRHPETAPFAVLDPREFFETMKRAASRFVPALTRARLTGFLQGPRMVLAYRDEDDARPSIVHDYGRGYLTVFSGKIDHCLEVAEEIRGRLLRYFVPAAR